MLSLILLLSPLLILFPSSLADQNRFWKDEAYDKQEYGAYPKQRFNTSELVAPIVNIIKWHPSCYQEQDYTFITPRGHQVPREGKGPQILDTNGSLIWGLYGYDEVYNFQAQRWKGEQYLTFWAGDDRVRGHGQGFYYMFDKHYNFVKKIGAVNGLKGDLHEFRVTDEDTGILTSYEIIQFDLSALEGERDGWIWNGIFQEINLDTDELIFQWNASEHFPANTTYRHFNKNNMGGKGDPYDYFHINSVQKDALGNYLVSGRYPHAVSYVEGKTGKIIWQFGGKNNDFQDISVGPAKAVDIAGQHDARFHKNGTELTIYDNGAEWDHKWREESRGIRVAIDTKKMTAKLLNEYFNEERTMSTSQGSVQILEHSSQNVLLGYGFSCLWAEFNQTSGEELCNVHFQSKRSFGHGGCQSYRLMKFPWVGEPLTIPETRFYPEEGIVYASWMGSTAIRHWSVIDMANGGKELRRVPRDGFETKINVTCPVTGEVYGAFAVAALDIHGNHLKTSLVHGSGKIRSSYYSPHLGVQSFYGALWMIMFLGAIATVYTGWHWLKHRRTGRFFRRDFFRRDLFRRDLFRRGDYERAYEEDSWDNGRLSSESDVDGFTNESKLLRKRDQAGYRDESDESQRGEELKEVPPLEHQPNGNIAR